MLKTTVQDPTKPKEKFFTKKKVVKWVVKSSVRFVVVGAINTIVPADTRIKKVKRFIGSNIIAEIVAEQAMRYIDSEMNEVVAEVNEVVNQAVDIVNGVVEGEVISSVQEPTDEIIEGEIVEDPPVTTNA